MPGVGVDGHDFFAVNETALEAVERARNGDGPTLVECRVNRYYGHFEGDAQSYRAPDEVKKVRESKDCIANFARRVLASGVVDRCELDIIDREVQALIDDSVAKAKAAAKPTEADLLTDVYVSY